MLNGLFGEDAAILRETNFQLLFLAGMIPVMGTSLLSPVLDSLINPLGTSAANIGLMVSFFTAPAIVMIPIAGMLADRYGRKPILVSSLLIFGIGGTAIAFTTDFRVVLALRLVQGIGFGGINPVIITSIGDTYAGTKETTGQGLRMAGSGLSGALFPLIAGGLVVVAWQYPFLLYAVAIPIAVFVYLWFDEPADARSSTGPERANGGSEMDSYTRALVGLARHPRVFSLIVARALPNTVWIAFLTYNSLIVVQLIGGTPPQAGLLAALGNITFAAIASQVGRITIIFDGRLYPLLGANAALVIGFLTVLFAPTIDVAIVGIVLTGAGFGVSLSLYRSIITGLAPPELRGGIVSLAEAGGRVGVTVTPIVMGTIIAVATPALGFELAIQLAGLCVVLVAGAGELLCLHIAHSSSNVSAEREPSGA